MKVLILADHFATGGGAGEIARVYAEDFSRDNEVLVLAAHSSKTDGIYKVFTHQLDYPRGLRNYLGIYHPRALKILKDHLQIFRPDVCYVHNLHTNWSYYALKILKRNKIKTVLVFHDVVAVTPYVKLCKIKYRKEGEKCRFNYRYSWFRHLREAKFTFNPLRNPIIRKLTGLASERWAVSQALADFLSANGITVDRVVRNKLPAGRKPGEMYADSIFLGGRLSTSKGVLEAVKYLGVLKTNYNLRPALLIVGQAGPVTEKMSILAEGLGVADQLKILGWLDKESYEKILSEVGVVIVPSICFDSLPTTILEAMRSARPVVATIFGGAGEVVDNGVTGFVCDPYNIEEFSSAIVKILTDKDLAKTMGLQGLKKFDKEFCLHGSA